MTEPASQFNDWRLVALSPLPGWALALLGVGALLAVWFAWQGLSIEGRSRRRWTLVSLRFLGAFLAFLLVLEPGIELLATTKLRGRIAILVDQSKSMSLPARPQGPTRAEVAASLLTGPERSAIEGRFQVDTFGFGESVWPIDASQSVTAAPSIRDTEHTFILPALEEAARSGGSRPLAGVILLTDGADNGGLQEGFDATGDANQKSALRQRLEALGAPVYAIDVTGGELKDLAIANVKVDDFAFVRNTVDVDVELSARGLGGVRVPVTLEKQGQVIVSQEAVVEDNKPVHVKLPFIPDTTGEFAFTVRLPVQEGEAVTANNTRSFVLKVIRDRVRVLDVAGRPSYDERFLRSLLKRDPNVDLVSFFILRTPANLNPASQDELSLIMFPVEEIFATQLHTFDLVIFDNFNFGPYHMGQYLPGIAQYVRDGGAFLMVGGDNSFAEGGYHGTPIEGILPVDFNENPVPPGDDPITPRLTVEGWRHPITSLSPDAAENNTIWQGLPQVHGLNHVTLKPDGHALLEDPSHPDLNGRPMPVVAVEDVGRGRSMAITTDETWRWSFDSARTGQPERWYDDFFHNAIRWLVRDPQLTQVRLQAEKERFSPSDPVAFNVTARTRDYGPATGAHVHVDVENTEKGSIVKSGDGVVSGDGTARLDLGTLPPGPYRATARVTRNNGEIGSAEAALVVEESGPELVQPAPRPDLLHFVADSTKGQYVPADGARLSQLPLKDPERVEIGQRKSKPLWDQLPVLLAMCLVFGTEWFLRRRWGFF